jgi:hypothetical protein
MGLYVKAVALVDFVLLAWIFKFQRFTIDSFPQTLFSGSEILLALLCGWFLKIAFDLRYYPFDNFVKHRIHLVREAVLLIHIKF